MTKFTEGRHTGEFLLSEDNFHRSRGRAIIKAGSGVFVSGTVIGQISNDGAKTAAAAAGTPAPAGATITASPTAAATTKVGTHRFECVQGGAGTASRWRHTDPDGKFVGIASGNTAYAGGGLSALTITDTATDPVVGEAFNVVVTSAAASNKWVPSPDASTAGAEGAETALAIALYGGDATSADVEVSTIERAAEVKGFALVFDSSVNSDPKKAAKIAQLKLVGIITR